jgi:Domain of unknown function (DUF4160)
MPTIYRLAKLKIQVFGGDHNPPHFHVVVGDTEVLVRIGDLSIMRGALRAADLRRALEWARLNQR